MHCTVNLFKWQLTVFCVISLILFGVQSKQILVTKISSKFSDKILTSRVPIPSCPFKRTLRLICIISKTGQSELSTVLPWEKLKKAVCTYLRLVHGED